MKKDRNIDNYIYSSLIITIWIMLFMYVIYRVLGSPSYIFECKIYSITGLYCPGCGCTRAFISILNGKFISSIIYNPTVLYAAILTVIYLITQTIGRVLKKKESWFVMKYSAIYLYIGATLLISVCIIKNILK